MDHCADERCEDRRFFKKKNVLDDALKSDKSTKEYLLYLLRDLEEVKSIRIFNLDEQINEASSFVNVEDDEMDKEDDKVAYYRD